MLIAADAWVGNDCEISVLGEIRIGQRTSIQHRSQLHGDVEFGAGCVCAANLYVASTSHRFRDIPYFPIRWQDDLSGSLPPDAQSRKVVIEDDCWLGINVVICPGVTLGRGTVVGANSVVTSSTLPYSVVAGAPARVIGTRLLFSPPSSVFSGHREHIPYFYAGFDLPPTEASWQCTDLKGRWIARRFALALRVMEGQGLRLTLYSLVAARLRHGSQDLAIPAGDSTLILRALPDARGLLWFDVDGWSPKCTAIGSAVGMETAIDETTLRSC